MQRKPIYIQSAEQISMQQPLSEEWMTQPVNYNGGLVPCINPAFREFISPIEARRMGGIMKRALATGIKVIRNTGIEHPDAIITGTSFGSLACTEKFLDDIDANGEEGLSPTHFMQSTHNTVGSALGINTKTHGYNTTYSHGRNSVELALLDAWMQLQLGKISNALVGGHDELVESYYQLLKTSGYAGAEGMVASSDVAMSMMLNAESHTEDLCELCGIHIINKPSIEDIKSVAAKLLDEADVKPEELSAVMTGLNGNPTNDERYAAVTETVFQGIPTLRYKHLFGENHTVSGLGIYAAAHCLAKGIIPEFIYTDDCAQRCSDLHSILFINIIDDMTCSLVLLKKTSNR